MRRISRLAENILAFQERLCSFQSVVTDENHRKRPCDITNGENRGADGNIVCIISYARQGNMNSLGYVLEMVCSKMYSYHYSGMETFVGWSYGWNYTRKITNANLESAYVRDV
jgi:hypothetical protein